MKIKYSKNSKIDLKEISEYIKKGSPKFAKIEIDKIQIFVSKLKNTPLMGKPFDDLGFKGIREVIFTSYRIFYLIDHKTNIIEILTIHHHSRSLSRNPAISDDE